MDKKELKDKMMDKIPTAKDIKDNKDLKDNLKDKKDLKDNKDLKDKKDLKDDKDWKDDKENKYDKDKDKFKYKDYKEDKGNKIKEEKDKVIKTDRKNRRKKKNTRVSWQTYIHKVLKTVHDDDCRLSAKAMSILDSFANDLFERISSEAVRLLRMNNKKTLTSMEIQTAARLVLPGELCKHAIADGAKAVSKYSAMEAQ